MDRERIGPYIIRDRIGAGGMGTVYKAYDERLKRWVAIKTILPSQELSPERRERLRREAQAAAALNHPAIAQVHDIVTEEDRDHIVMEYVEGRTLGSMLGGAPVDLEHAVRLTRQIAEGLAAAHAQGIVHRDLKAENVMVTPDGRAKILDFGLAKRVDPLSEDDTLTKDGIVMGTCRAMSPEQAEGRPVDHCSDLFSLGSLLYQMATGHHPFATDSPLETMRRVVFHDPPRARVLNPEVPEGLDGVIAALLRKETDQRPQEAATVAMALQAVSSLWTAPTTHQAILSSLTGQRTFRRTFPWRTAVAAAAAAALVLAAAGAVRWWPRTPPPPLAIAVLAPTVADGADSERAPLAARAVRMSLLDAVASLQGLAALEPSEIDAISGGPQEVARAVAADEVIVSELEGCAPLCRVTLRRVGANGQVRPGSVFVLEAPADELQLLDGAVAARLRDAFPGHEPRGDVAVRDISAADYEAYLQVRQQLDHPEPGVTRDELLDRLEEIRRRAPDFLEVHLAEARAARILYTNTKEPEYLERARGAARRAENITPLDPRTLFSSFDVHEMAGEIEEAKAVLESLKRVDPANPTVHSLSARLALRHGDSASAVDQFLRVVELRPSWANYWRLADAEFHSGRNEDARAHLEAGLERAPGNRYLRSKLAELELLAGDLSRAEWLYAGLAEEFQSPVYLANLGMSQMLLGAYDRAVATLTLAQERNPMNPETLMNLADSHKLAGDSQTADRWYRSALDAANALEDPGSAKALVVKAQSLAHIGDAKEAAGLVQQLLRRAPEDPESHFTAALVNCVIGERTSALVAAEQALRLGLNPRWFLLPWFDDIREDLGIENLGFESVDSG